MSSIQKVILPLAIAGLCSLGAFSQTGSSQNKTSTSTEHAMAKTKATGQGTFLREAGYADLAEVELGQLAEQKASSPEVKQFAERMVKDHTKNDDQLKQVAKQEGVTLPDNLSPKDEETKGRLEKFSGKEFDHAYMLDMVRNHTTDVAKFKDESKENISPAVKNYIDQTLPTLESHLKEARSVEPQTARAVHKTSTSKAS
jgi:putative membrane protein